MCQFIQLILSSRNMSFFIIQLIIRKLQTRNNIHAGELLEEQFAGVRHWYLRHTSRWFAIVAPRRICQTTARITDVNIKCIRGYHQTLHNQHTRSVWYQTIPFHLTQTKTSFMTTTLRRLPREHGPRTASTSMHLVLHHMLEFLIINLPIRTNRQIMKVFKNVLSSFVQLKCKMTYRSRINVHFQWFTRYSRVEYIFAHVIVSMFE